MNLLHISSNYPPDIGGLATSVPPLARELIEKGHKTCVLTKDAKEHPSFEILRGIPVYRSIRIPGHFYNPPIASIKSLAMGLKARKIIEKEKIEIIHSHDINVSAIAGIIGTQFKDVKKVTKFPGDLAWELLALVNWSGEPPEVFLNKNDLSIKILERIQKVICDRYDRIIAPSKFIKGILTKYTKVESSKIDVVYNATDVNEYPPERIINLKKKLHDKSEYLVISAGRMMPYKGYDFLIDAFKTLPKNIKLILLGDGPERNKLEKMARGLNIHFVGAVPHYDVQAYIRASDVYILPSIHETSPLAALDCLATQTPIIATQVGGTPELISHDQTGLLIESKNSEAISNKIKTLLSDERLYNNIKKNQKNEYKKYLWENMIQNYIEVYNNVLES